MMTANALRRPIAGSVVAITGGASGIGATTARLFVEAGARVWIGDRDIAAAQAHAAAIGATALACDVTQEGDVMALVDAAVAAGGRIDTLINNAGGIGVRGSIAAIDEDGWQQTLTLLLTSVFYGMKHAARHMIAQKCGAILSTASNASVAALGPHCYAACKAGVLGLTRSVAAEMARYGVTVNAIAPGMLATGLTAALYGGEDATRRLSAEVSPLGRALETEDIARWFLHLAGPAGVNVTGQTIVVDGGATTLIRPNAHY